MNRSIPFTLLFEEASCNPKKPEPVYNAELDLSVIWNGAKIIPFVTYEKHNLGTRTFTEVEREVTDTDIEDHNSVGCGFIHGLGTKTFTKAEGEVTDTDLDSTFDALKTHSFTFVEKEVTDEDE